MGWTEASIPLLRPAAAKVLGRVRFADSSLQSFSLGLERQNAKVDWP
jgi:hypothetical protein